MRADIQSKVIPLPLKMLRTWVRSGNFAIVGSMLAKLFRRSPHLATRLFGAISSEVSFLKEGDIVVSHPDFQVFLSGYRLQAKRMNESSRLSQCFFFEGFDTVRQLSEVSSADYWQQIRYLVKGASVDRHAMPLFFEAEVLYWPGSRSQKVRR